MKRVITVFVCLLVILSCTFILVYAKEDTPTPYINNSSSVQTDFKINSSGDATVTTMYVGESGVTTGATIKTKIQKRFLFFFWNDVDIGVENNTWIDECVGHTYFGTHSVNLGSGTYKAIVEYTIRGTGGEPDVITQEIERTH